MTTAQAPATSPAPQSGSAASDDHHLQSRPAPRGRYLLTLCVAALGVVYGDIGTSPLYALRECFHGEHGIAPTPTNVMGVLSMIFWSLILVISGKYITFVLRADNQGEGGILALTALATPIKILSRTERWPLVLLGIFGAALLYGDGMITPAISVLSAVEGLQLATPIFTPYVLPITIGMTGYWILGTVVLAITGGESLYVDLGHFGRRPIRIAWFTVVLPALLLNY